MKKFLWIVFMTLLSGCAASAHDLLHYKLVATAQGVAEVSQLVESDYRAKAKALREAIHARGGTLEEYEKEIQPIDAEYERRVRALGSLGTILRANADLNDTIGEEMTLANAMRIARNAARAARGLIEVLEQGAGVVPGLRIPEAAKRAFALLEQFAEAAVAQSGDDQGAR